MKFVTVCEMGWCHWGGTGYEGGGGGGVLTSKNVIKIYVKLAEIERLLLSDKVINV